MKVCSSVVVLFGEYGRYKANSRVTSVGSAMTVADRNRLCGSGYGGNGMATEDVVGEIHGFSEPDSTPTPWTAGIAQLRAADTFWLSTVRPDGRPHVTPLIAVWHAEALWFATGPEERKARNLAENPACVLTTGRSDLIEGALDVVLEGHAEQVTNDAELEPVATAFAVKYPAGPWDFVVRDGGFSDRDAAGRAIVFRVRPARGLGFVKGDRFSQTTWRGFG
jgi:hypothetical protein